MKLALATAVAAYAVKLAAAESIYDIAAGNEDFSTLTAAIDATGLGDVLKEDGTFTIFAPPNSAFEKLNSTLVTKLLDPTWQPQLQDVLAYHALGSEVLSTDLSDGLTAATLNFQGEEITINLDPARVNEVSNILVDAGLVDIEADNGVIHAIDTVLTPASVTNNIVDIAAGHEAFSTLVTAVTSAGLADALSGEGPLTVFAPTNEAFAKLPEGTVEALLEDPAALGEILKYHVVAANAVSSGLASGDVETLSGDSVAISVSDDGVMVNDANVAVADIIASNGIIHVIDSVLLPPSDPATTAAPIPATLPAVVDETTAAASCKSIVEIAASDDTFSTLVAAVTAAGFVDALSGEGPLTVFAPTNDAFAALPEGTVEALLEDPAALGDILTYHVVAGNVLSTDLESGDVETLNGDSVAVTVSDEGVMINDSNVIAADVIACNGVIHVIDSVLLPPSDDVVTDPVDGTKPPTMAPTSAAMTVSTVVAAAAVAMGSIIAM